MEDPAIREAISAHAAVHGMAPDKVARKVEQYIEEMFQKGYVVEPLGRYRVQEHKEQYESFAVSPDGVFAVFESRSIDDNIWRRPLSGDARPAWS